MANLISLFILLDKKTIYNNRYLIILHLVLKYLLKPNMIYFFDQMKIYFGELDASKPKRVNSILDTIRVNSLTLGGLQLIHNK